ncbi:MAG: LuxR C-terminal-related transcriptional regulator [Planctomycetota bacterium]|jgi:DNA-binding NarL/FixJ family response regulator|nr:response regulator transcription factor [Blastopirellula sp.]
MKIRIYLVDDQPVVYEGLTAAAERSGWSGSFIVRKTLAEVLEKGPELKAGEAIVCELRVGKESLLDLLEGKRQEPWVKRVIVFSGHADQLSVAKSLSIGVFDFVAKTSPVPNLFEAIERAVRGDQPNPESLMLETKARLRRPRQNVSNEIPLTKREWQVLQHIAIGLSNREIGRALGISVETAKEHVQNILRKLDVTDRTQAAVWAVRHEVVDA